jgi:hypothetical protein
MRALAVRGSPGGSAVEFLLVEMPSESARLRKREACMWRVLLSRPPGVVERYACCARGVPISPRMPRDFGVRAEASLVEPRSIPLGVVRVVFCAA